MTWCCGVQFEESERALHRVSASFEIRSLPSGEPLGLLIPLFRSLFPSCSSSPGVGACEKSIAVEKFRLESWRESREVDLQKVLRSSE